MDRSDKMRKDLVEKGSELKALDNETSALVDKIKNFQKTSSELCDKERTRDIPIKIQEVGFSTHGGCDQSKEDAYSSMTPDPTSRFLEVPKEKSYEYEQKNMAEYTTDMCNVVHEHVQQLIPDNQQIEKLDRDTNLLTQQSREYIGKSRGHPEKRILLRNCLIGCVVFIVLIIIVCVVIIVVYATGG